MVADSLKGLGDPHKLIFGLQIPQIAHIARSLSEELSEEELRALADELWSERDCRESRLLAPYLLDGKNITRSKAEEMLDDCRSAEETDILVFRCLRYCPDARAIRKDREGTYDAVALGRFLD